jgi:O-antigen ligase
VGPGNAGFFFTRYLPPYGFQLTEIQQVLDRIDFGFPNPKNFWIRLLAEGGLVGFSSYFIWYTLSIAGALKLWHTSDRIYRVIGFAGVIGAVTYFVEGFSIDSYALPQFWLLCGILTAAISQSGLLHGQKSP